MSQAHALGAPVPTFALRAPVSGVVVPLDRVPDPVFSSKMLGDGIAIDPTEGVLCAPCAGRITNIHRGRHALSLATGEGDIILLHVGIDTVQLGGAGFDLLVREGQEVTEGQELLRFDLDTIARRAVSAMVEMVITEGRKQPSFVDVGELVTAGKEELLRLTGPTEEVSGEIDTQNALRSKPLRLSNPSGLHARPAARISALAKQFRATLWVWHGAARARATSVTELMALDLVKDDEVSVTAHGPQAQAALTALEQLIASGIGEDAHAPATAEVTKARSTEPGVLGGIAASPGLAIGVVRLARPALPSFAATSNDADAERNRLRAALAAATGDLESERQGFEAKQQHEKAQIFAAHAELLADASLLNDAESRIAKGASAPAALQQVLSERADKLSISKNAVMRQRVDDLKDVGQRVLERLLGVTRAARQLEPGTVLCFSDLTPSEVAGLDPSKLKAVLSAGGSATSHAAIIARSMALPYVAGLGAELEQLREGQRVIVDAERGLVHANPTAAAFAETERQITVLQSERETRLKAASQPCVTRDGRRIEVAANIGTVSEAEKVLAHGADGVGLLRSEFMFMERQTAPSEAEQAEAMQRIARALGPERTLVVRTLDVGGDKPLSYMPLPAEENPFLGIRGLRLSLRFPEQFDAQLRATLSAAPLTCLHVMFPMVAELDELLKAKARLLELAAAMPSKPKVAVGVMIEVPSAALMADVLAPHVDFFSIGTNDLTQYTLAMDRGHPELAKQADAFHPAVLRLIKATAEAGERHKKWVGVCGGLAAETLATPLLIGLGITELSAPAPSAPDLKARVRQLDFAECRALAERALKLPSAAAVRELLATTSPKA